MERGNGLADLTLVNKYFPVANYSYPRNESARGYFEPRSNLDRSSLGSEGILPGLVDDKSDSDASFSSSFESDRNYEVRAAELWNSFWEPSAEDPKPRIASNFPRKDHFFLAQPPAPGRKTLAGTGRRHNSNNNIYGTTPWPLNGDAAQASRSRKPAATYSPFPKPMPLPPRAKPASPSWENSRPREQLPKRPARQDKPPKLHIKPSFNFTGFLLPSVPRTKSEQDDLYAPEVSPTTITVERPSTAKEPRTLGSVVFPPQTLTVEIPRPTTSHEVPRAASPVEPKRPATPYIPTPPVCHLPTPPLDDLYGRCSPTPSELERVSHICPVHGNPSSRDPYATNSYLLHPAYLGESGGCCLEVRGKEPHSFFDDSDDDGEDGGKAFFRRFHKRSVSDLRRWRRSGDGEASPRSRSRTNTAPSSPDILKRRGGVFNRMLGRRNS